MVERRSSLYLVLVVLLQLTLRFLARYLKLIMYLYLLDKGDRYLIDDQGRQIPLTRAWQKLFAYVQQGNQLMNGTIREVIAFGEKEKMNDEIRMRKAIEIACADEFIDKLDEGLDTVLGERGMGPSSSKKYHRGADRASRQTVN